MDLFDLWIQWVQSEHQILELFLCKFCSFLFCPGPGQGSVFQAFVQKQESISHPKQTFDPVGSSSAEKKKSSFFKRILMVSVTDDHGQSVNAFPQIHISAGEYNPADSCCIVKHDGSPGRSCQAGLPKYR